MFFNSRCGSHGSGGDGLCNRKVSFMSGVTGLCRGVFVCFGGGGREVGVGLWGCGSPETVSSPLARSPVGGRLGGLVEEEFGS